MPERPRARSPNARAHRGTARAPARLWPADSRCEQLQLGDRRPLPVFEMRPTVGDQRLAMSPPSDLARALVYVQAHRRGLAVVAVGELAVGIGISDAHQLRAIGVDLADQLARPVDGFE